MSSAKSRLPAIHRLGYKVFAPTGRRKDGKWSHCRRIIAIFLDGGEARAYRQTKATEYYGPAVYVKSPPPRSAE